jgi:hypothetical protein
VQKEGWDREGNSLPHHLPPLAGDMLQSVFGHRHVVSCVDFSPDEGLNTQTGTGLIGTGSHDATVLLWRWSGKLNRVVGALSRSQGRYYNSFRRREGSSPPAHILIESIWSGKHSTPSNSQDVFLSTLSSDRLVSLMAYYTSCPWLVL